MFETKLAYVTQTRERVPTVQAFLGEDWIVFAFGDPMLGKTYRGILYEPPVDMFQEQQVSEFVKHIIEGGRIYQVGLPVPPKPARLKLSRIAILDLAEVYSIAESHFIARKDQPQARSTREAREEIFSKVECEEDTDGDGDGNCAKCSRFGGCPLERELRP